MSDRYDRGMAVLSGIDAEAGERFVASLADVAPHLAEHVVSYAYGDVYTRPGLGLRDRALVTLSSLASIGGCEAQVEFHVNAALNVGLSPAEIVEAVTHLAVYTGFPRALNAMAVVRKVFGERGIRIKD